MNDIDAEMLDNGIGFRIIIKNDFMPEFMKALEKGNKKIYWEIINQLSE